MERLLDYFKPNFYHLDLAIDRHQETIVGEVKISGIVRAECVKFHAVGLKIESIESYIEDHRTINPDSRPCRFEYDGSILSIPTTPEIAPYFYKTRDVNSINDEDPDFHADTVFVIKYKTKLGKNMEGCYLSAYDYDGKKQLLATTQFESHYAREAFPCIDEPAAKAIFYLTLTIPDIAPSDVVLANTPLESNYQNRFSFAPTPRMSTYLLAWVIGPFQNVSTVNKNGVRVSSYCALNQPLESLLFANQIAARALEYYDQKFGTQYPLPKLDQVALPDFESGAMENWGLVTYRESMMLASSDASLDVKRTVATTVTHELSHQWFGNLVTMNWWNDLWLNESFATVVEYFAADALYPELKVWQDFFTGDCLAALKRDCLPGVQAVKQAVHSPAEIATLFDSAIVYAKGARLVLMLIRLMGEENFDKGLRYYFKKYAYQNTVGDDLWTALQPYADFDVRRFMDAWITQPGYPEFSGEHEKRFLITGDTDDTKWPLPEIKDDMSGHYLINLDDTAFSQKLAEFDQLSTEQKLRLLIDRMLLAKTPDVASASLLDLLPKFQAEDSAAVLEIIVTIIADLKLFCPPVTDAAGNYKKFLHNIYSERFAEVSFEPISDADQSCVRDILLSIARYTEDQKILDRLVTLYRDNFSRIDSELRTHVLAAKFRRDETEVFDSWLEKYQSETDPDIKRTLLAVLVGGAKQDAHQQKLISLLDQTDVIRPQDHIFLYVYLLRNHRTRERTIKWLTGHWDFVVQLTGDKSVEDYPRYTANVIRTPAEAKIFYDFFNAKLDDPILARALKVARAEIDARLRLIEFDSPAVVEKLKTLMKGN